jgi:hypothetical protein
MGEREPIALILSGSVIVDPRSLHGLSAAPVPNEGLEKVAGWANCPRERMLFRQVGVIVNQAFN